MIIQFHNRFWIKFIRLIILMIIFLPESKLLFAQDSSGNERLTAVWARLGVGIAGGKDFFGFSGSIGLQYSSPIGLINTRYIEASRRTIEPTISNASRRQEIKEISVSLGFSTDIRPLFFSVSAGLGTIWFREQKVGGSESITLMTIPIEAQAIIRPFRVIGFGGMLSFSINTKKTITSAMIVMQIGVLY